MIKQKIFGVSLKGLESRDKSNSVTCYQHDARAKKILITQKPIETRS
jgi:hypothetical protein